MSVISPRDETQTTNGSLTRDRLDQLQASFEGHPTARMMRNAVTQAGVDEVALDRGIISSTDHTFSHLLDDWSVTNQKRSGRCWMFAGLNLFRPAAMKSMKLKSFEFSQNYTLFWDKFERSNYFLEAIIDTADRDVDDRTVAWLLERPLDDGGQWNMFVNVIQKHGVVPKSVMPESKSSSNTPRMNAILLAQLRQAAEALRAAAAAGSSLEKLRESKQGHLDTIFRILSIHLGSPPARFDWQWNDKDREFHREGEMTPLEFSAKFVTPAPEEFVCLVHDPRPTSPIGRPFTVEYLGNVVGGEIVKYLNVDIATMKQIAVQTITDGQPVWMGCDVGKMMQRTEGIWDAQLFDYQGVYDADFSLDKSGRLTHHETLMTHAMLFTGVDVVDTEQGQQTRRWRVENSWGDENGRKGYYVMNDSWFDEYMFEIAAHEKYLSDDLLQASRQEPI
ncbi:MAG: C1 family peptidase, partial [Planctomycetaceae bacterium]